MANPMQKAMARRRAIYIALIVGLLTLSLFWRGKIPLPEAISDPSRVASLLQGRRIYDESAVPPPANQMQKAGDWIASRSILNQASRNSLDLREVEQGEAEVDAAFVRLLLTGSRGFAVTALWQAAGNYQKRNEYHKLEQTVNAITRLQPNFTMPWLFQSWNLTYNVSVENDRLTDAYYYIARGIEILSRGERLNRDSPDMRYNIGFYYQNKFSVHDKVSTMRSMMQLSCLKPSERNPDLFRDPQTKRMDSNHWEKFREFVRKNPQLCRRLRERLNYTKPAQIIRFLEDNRSVPTRYDADRQDALRPVGDQFPALPPAFAEGPDEPNPQRSEYDDGFDAFDAARVWFLYATVVVPPPQSEPDGSPYLTQKDRFRYRMPRAPTMILFRQGPMRAQSYLASDRLQKEGWFDADTRWNPDRRADTPEENWFGDAPEQLAAGTSSREAWVRAADMWRLHGERTGLLFDSAKLARFQELARTIPSDVQPAMLSPEQLKAYAEPLRARNVLRYYDLNRSTTNFAFFLSSSEAEQDPQTVKARAKLFEAEQNRLDGRIDAAAIRQYSQALADWRQVLLKYKDFARTDKTEEDSYEAQLNLVFMMEKSPEMVARARDTLQAVQALAPAAADGVTQFPFSKDLARDIAERESNVRIAAFDPRVQDRVTQILSRADAAKNEWPDAARAVTLVAGEYFARKASAPPTAAEREKAANDPVNRAEAVKLLIEASVKPAWPDVATQRDAIARQVVLKEFAWLPLYREAFRDDENLWTRPPSVLSVRQRLNLVRPKSSDPVIQTPEGR